MFKVTAFRLDTRAQTGAPLSYCRINDTLVKFTVTLRWERRYTVQAVHYGGQFWWHFTQHYLVAWPAIFCANKQHI